MTEEKSENYFLLDKKKKKKRKKKKEFMSILNAGLEVWLWNTSLTKQRRKQLCWWWLWFCTNRFCRYKAFCWLEIKENCCCCCCNGRVWLTCNRKSLVCPGGLILLDTLTHNFKHKYLYIYIYIYIYILNTHKDQIVERWCIYIYIYIYIYERNICPWISTLRIFEN